MNHKHFAANCLFLLAVFNASPACAHTIGWPFLGFENFFSGQKEIRQVLESNWKQTTTVGGERIETQLAQLMVIRWQPLGFNHIKGVWRVRQTIERLRLSYGIGGCFQVFDSADTDKRPGLSALLAQLTQFELILEFDPDLKLASVQGREEFLEAIDREKEFLRACGKELVSQAVLRDVCRPAFSFVRAGRLKAKETRALASKSYFGALLGDCSLTVKFHVEKATDHLAHIRVNVEEIEKDMRKRELLLSRPPRHSYGTGTILYDQNQQAVREADVRIHLEGKHRFSAGNGIDWLFFQIDRRTKVKVTVLTK
ncbi:MAG: hypothetical protein KatS3mg105_3750 [Gemmatales bacterium]|nr:MAG: hypothetical protein KatS3mg105_3750 [Gemmatales bacterium]